MTTVHFSEIQAPAPDMDAIQNRYDTWRTRLSQQPADTIECVREWDQLRRSLSTWQALVELRFNQDTKNEQYQAARKHCDELRPKLTELEVVMKRQLLEEEHRQQVEQEYGAHVLALWEVDILTYDPAIAGDLIRESELEASYNERLANAKISFRGSDYNLSEITKFLEDLDRPTRHDADAVRWQWFSEHREELDDIFDQLVKLRHDMAKKLGFNNYIELGYRRMSRVDYGREDVERYRDAVQTEVVPLAQQLLENQADRLGLSADELRHWDEPLYDRKGNPRPEQDYEKLLVMAQQMFDDMGYGLDDFFALMRTSDLMDLQIRAGKANGGFCTSFDDYGLPYIFANFNGTKGDVEVFTHEIGHAFQAYMSRKQPLLDYLWPTYESCEIHSMGLEFLTYPYMERFFGGDAKRFRTIHLTQSLLFLPYGVAVDHFQHRVYAEPDATPEERFQFWQEMEARYLPWRNYGDIKHASAGGRWQLQRHIYLSPFYYIDYTLAQACALQFWVRANQDRKAAMSDFVALCQRGGAAAFQQLAKSAGLTSPFEPGCLSEVVAQAKQSLL